MYSRLRKHGLEGGGWKTRRIVPFDFDDARKNQILFKLSFSPDLERFENYSCVLINFLNWDQFFGRFIFKRVLDWFRRIRLFFLPEIDKKWFNARLWNEFIFSFYPSVYLWKREGSADSRTRYSHDIASFQLTTTMLVKQPLPIYIYISMKKERRAV